MAGVIPVDHSSTSQSLNSVSRRSVPAHSDASRPAGLTIRRKALPRENKHQAMIIAGRTSKGRPISLGNFLSRMAANSNKKPLNLLVSFDAQPDLPSLLRLEVRSGEIGPRMSMYLQFYATGISAQNIECSVAKNEDWPKVPSSIPVADRQAFRKLLREDQVLEITFNTDPQSFKSGIEHHNILPPTTFKDVALDELVTYLRETSYTASTFHMLVRKTNNSVNVSENVTELVGRWRAEIMETTEAMIKGKTTMTTNVSTMFDGRNYLRHFYDHQTLDLNRFKIKRPILEWDLPKEVYASVAEMVTRLTAALAAQHDLMNSTFMAIRKMSAKLQCVRDPLGRDGQYQAVLSFKNGTPRELTDGTVVEVRWKDSDIGIPHQTAEEVTDESTDYKAWSAVILPSEPWHKLDDLNLCLSRPIRGSRWDERIIEIPEPFGSDESLEELFQRAHKHDVSISVPTSKGVFGRLRDALSIFLEGRRRQVTYTGLGAALHDIAVTWAKRNSSEPVVNMPADLLVWYQRCDRAGDFVDETAYFSEWHDVFSMQTPTQKSDFLSDSIRQNLTGLAESLLKDHDHRTVVDHLSNTPPISTIIGPPGTGKSTTVASIIVEKALESFNTHVQVPILVTAPSNSATDVLAKKILDVLVNKGDHSDVLVIRCHLSGTELNYLEGATNTRKTTNSNVEPSWVQRSLIRPDGTFDVDFEEVESEFLSLINMAKSRARTMAPRSHNAGRQIVYVEDSRFKDTRLSLAYNALRIAGFEGFPSLKWTDSEAWRLFLEGVRAISSDTQLDPVRRQAYEESRTLLLEYTLRVASVVCTTPINLTNALLVRALGEVSETCFIDEAGLATIPEAIIPIAFYRIKNLILSGDPDQLQPVVKTVHAPTACEEELRTSVIKYVMANHNDSATLLYQRRSIRHLMDMASKLVYQGRLKDHPEYSLPKYHPLTKVILEHLQGFFWSEPLLLPTVVAELHGRVEVHRTSMTNEVNRRLTCNIVASLLQNKILKATEIGCVVGYKAQMLLLRRMFKEMDLKTDKNEEYAISKVSVGTIELFQGDEREFMVVDLVASHGVGFMKEKSRLNVALTRAKAGQVVLGNWKSLNDKNLEKNPVAAIMSPYNRSCSRVELYEGHHLTKP